MCSCLDVGRSWYIIVGTGWAEVYGWKPNGGGAHVVETDLSVVYEQLRGGLEYTIHMCAVSRQELILTGVIVMEGG